MTADYRALCAELVAELEAWEKADHQFSDGGTVRADADYELAPRARAALAQPEPVGPTDNDLLRCMIEAADSVPSGQATGIIDWEREAIAAAHAILARWGRPATTPIPVSERLPGPEDCNDKGECWYWHPGEECWEMVPVVTGTWDEWSHWLPAHALPLPGQPAPTAPAP